MSWRKTVFSAAASSKVSGGTKRVLVRPGAEALAMMAMPQVPPALSLSLKPSALAIRYCPRKIRLKFESNETKLTGSFWQSRLTCQSLPAQCLQVVAHQKVMALTNS